MAWNCTSPLNVWLDLKVTLVVVIDDTNILTFASLLERLSEEIAVIEGTDINFSVKV